LSFEGLHLPPTMKLAVLTKGHESRR